MENLFLQMKYCPERKEIQLECKQIQAKLIWLKGKGIMAHHTHPFSLQWGALESPHRAHTFPWFTFECY